MRCGAADRPVVRGDGPEAQAQAGENPHVRIVHDLVRLQHRVLVGVEGVCILHDELARAHHAETRPHLVAEFRLDVVEIEWKLLVALDLLARDVGDDFLGCGLDDEVALMAVLQAQELRAVLVPAARLLPQLCRLDDRHQELDGSGCVHFLAHHRLDLAQNAQAERKPRVDAGCEPLDHARAQHQPVAGELGLGRRFLERRQEILRYAHGRFVVCKPPIFT